MEMTIWSQNSNACLAPSSTATSCPGARVRRSRPLQDLTGGNGEAGSETHILNKVTSQTERSGNSRMRACRPRCPGVL